MKRLIWLPFLILLVARLAQPVLDGDLFWQMAYGRDLLERHSLIPDHTLYSWTPSQTDFVYCSWLAEIPLFLLYQLGGLTLLFATRYAIGILIALLAIKYEPSDDVALPTLLSLSLVASGSGLALKPEMFSWLAFNLLAFLLFRARTNPKIACWLPVLFLLWANTHGVVFFGLMMLAAFVFGQVLHKEKPLLLPAALSFLSLLATPYGWVYPAQKLAEFHQMLTGNQTEGDRAAYMYLVAHQPTWQVPGHYREYFVVMLAIALTIAFKRRDPVVLCVNLAGALLYLTYLRATYYWPPFFLFSVLPVKTPPNWRAYVFTIYLFLCVRGVYEQRVWFGIAPASPVAETEFIAQNLSQAERILTDYDGGGYVLWRLGPHQKVMVDSRSFPYRSFLKAYFDFENGGPISFLDRFKGPRPEVAVIALKHQPMWRTLLRSPDYEAVFMGPNAVVFAHPGLIQPRIPEPTSPLQEQFVRALPKRD